MPKNKVLAMTGTQKDIDEVAKLMGWRKGMAIALPFQWYPKDTKDGYRSAPGDWNPFKSWGDAGMVVERLEELEWHMQLESNTAGRHIKWCTFVNNKFQRVVSAMADNVPTAICQAALLTLEVKDDKE